MSTLKNTDFHICFIDEEAGCRSLIRNWAEIDGYVEIVYQEYSSGAWRDVSVSPALGKDDIKSLIDSLEVAMENFL